MKYPTLENGSSRFGAQMGRQNTITDADEPIKFRLYSMPMSPCLAYDSGGAYWGCGSVKTGWMFHAIGQDIAGEKNEMFIRAKSRDEAKKAVVEEFANARFYR